VHFESVSGTAFNQKGGLSVGEAVLLKRASFLATGFLREIDDCELKGPVKPSATFFTKNGTSRDAHFARMQPHLHDERRTQAQTCDSLRAGWLFFFEQESTKKEAKPGGMEVERHHNGLYLFHAAFVGGICRYESFEEAATKLKNTFKNFDATAFYKEIGSPQKKDRPATKTSAAQKPAAKTRSAPQSKTTKDTLELLNCTY
jgi:hypothetical protein